MKMIYEKVILMSNEEIYNLLSKQLISVFNSFNYLDISYDEFERFSKHFTGVKTACFYGGNSILNDKAVLTEQHPTIIVGTPGRIHQHVREKSLDLSELSIFVLDECDKLLENLDMRDKIQKIFISTPTNKQVMMFSATLPTEIRAVAKKFMKNPREIYVDDESKLTLHGLQQHYINLQEAEKTKKLMTLLDALEFNQVVIFVKSPERADALSKILQDYGFPSVSINGHLPQAERDKCTAEFKSFQYRLLVSTDLFGRGIDIEKVNIVFNYDMPNNSDSYLHRVGRAGRFGTKGLAITFVTTVSDNDTLKTIQDRFSVKITPLPSTISVDSYMNA